MNFIIRRNLSFVMQIPMTKYIFKSTIKRFFDIKIDAISATSRQFSHSMATNRKIHSFISTKKFIDKQQEKEMLAIWPEVYQEIVKFTEQLEDAEATNWLMKVLEHNVLGGKQIRALLLVNTYLQLAVKNDFTENNVKLARILAWIIEVSQAFCLIEDDIMDNSKLRRNRKCWYLEENVGLSAINDGLFLEQVAYNLFTSYFSDHSYYCQLLKTIQKIALRTSMGQSLDLLSRKKDKPNLDVFTISRYNAIVKFKSAYYTFVLPVQLAMYLAKVSDPTIHMHAESILLEIGHFFQVQDDYLDFFGDSQITGKQGNDIQEGKCSWLCVVALQRASPVQRKILQECYGSNDADNIAKVGYLYNDLDLSSVYSIYKEDSQKRVYHLIEQIPCTLLPRHFFYDIFNKIYTRNS